MILTAVTHSRTLHAWSLCLCLLLGHFDGPQAETTQPEGEILSQDPELPTGGIQDSREILQTPPTLPAFLLELPTRGVQNSQKNPRAPPTIPSYLLEPVEDNLPMIRKNGNLYFDLAGANESHVVIGSVSKPVKGITATSKECLVEYLSLHISFWLDEDLFTNCPLRNLTLKGEKERCLQVGQMLQRLDVTVDMTGAFCNDIWYYKTAQENLVLQYTMQEGVRKFKEFNITSCLIEECVCKWYFNSNDSYNMNMDCEGLGLTDEDLTKMSTVVDRVLNIYLNRNNLSSMDSLINYLKPNHATLKTLFLDHNHMTALPRLGDFFPNLIHISLVSNDVKKIDFDDFDALVSRKGLVMHLNNNPFLCDAHMAKFKTKIHNLCKEGWKFCIDFFKNLTCRSETNGELVPLYKLTEEEDAFKIDWWLLLNITLGVLNVLLIFLIFDLVLILKRGNGRRRPKMDYVVCVLKGVLLRVFPWGQVEEEECQQDEWRSENRL